VEGSRAAYDLNVPGKIARLWLSPDWEDMPVNDTTIKRAAFHEVCELMLNPLVILAESRYSVTPTAIEEATHDIIRRLENTMFKKVRV
jgi:hypothetical protein